jgi:hypothetical protein
MDQSVPNGSEVSWCVAVEGSQPMMFRWQRDGENIPGATGNCLTISNASPANAGLYSLVLSNPFGTNTVQAALSTVDLKMFAGLTIAGPTNRPYTVQYVNALQPTNTWQTLTTNLVLPSSPHVWIDLDSPNARQRYYQAFPRR